MSIFLNLMPYVMAIVAIAMPAVILGLLWRGILAVERLTVAAEQIARNTRSPHS